MRINGSQTWRAVFIFVLPLRLRRAVFVAAQVRREEVRGKKVDLKSKSWI
jgi:hypothetical protein